MSRSLEVFLDMTTTTHGQGRAAGAIRVESEFATALLATHPDATTAVSWSSAAEHFLELDDDVALRYAGAQHVPSGDILGRPLVRRPRENAARRVLLVTGAGWLSNPTFFHGLFKARRDLDAELHVVVHDLVHLRFPQWVSRDEAARFGSTLEAMLAGADRVLVYSDSTGRDIRRVSERRGLRVNDIGRMALGTALTGGPNGHTSPGLESIADRPFVLYVSTIARRKNHEFLAQVWARLADELGDRLPRLVLAGRVAPDQEAAMERIRRDPALVDHVIHVAAATDADLVWLHEQCLFTVFPSLYEGWGLPVAESLALGKVCLASNASSIPEVAGGVTPLVDPLDVKGWCDGIRTLLDPSARSAAELRVREYRATTWAEAAARLWDAVRSSLVAGGCPPTLRVGHGPSAEPLDALSTVRELWSPVRDSFGAVVAQRARWGLSLGTLPAHGLQIAVTADLDTPGPLYVETEVNGLVVDGCVIPTGVSPLARTLDVPRDVLLRRGLLDVVMLLRPLDGSRPGSSGVRVPSLSARELTAAEEKAAVDARRDIWRLGDTLSFSAGSPHLALLRRGWGEPAPWGTWSVDPVATVSFRPMPQPGEPLVVRAMVRGFVPAAQSSLDVDVLVDGTPVTTWRFRYPADFTFVERSVTIPPELLADGVVHLQLSMPTVRSPRELGMSEDDRRLGVGVARVHCTTESGAPPPHGWKARRGD
jgi:glycosyltransferase involved in cell wall biosynthesis